MNIKLLKVMPQKKKNSRALATTQRVRFAAILSLTLVLLAGCGTKQDPRITALRAQFVTTTPIAGETAVSTVREQLKADDASESVPLVIRGQIMAGDMPPWESGKAAFVLTDTTGHDGDDEHNPHTCPFCSRNIQDYMANVYFRDEQGQVIDIDSRELLDLKEKQTVIIQGTGSIAADGTLEVDAKKIFVRR